jgi:N-acetylglutamate synthase-like GNAT family acetyltransferase
MRKTRSYLLRRHKPGDMGWLVYRHGVIGWKEQGFDERFEVFVANIISKFIQHHDPRRERCWIVEMRKEVVGCVFLIKKSETIAQLRLLLIEPKARGLGIGARLVKECVTFARRAGYRKIVLGTDNAALAARHIYQRAGFRLIRQKPHNFFGQDLIEETWQLVL